MFKNAKPEGHALHGSLMAQPKEQKVLRLRGPAPRWESQKVTRRGALQTGAARSSDILQQGDPLDQPREKPFRPHKRMVPEYFAQLADPNAYYNRKAGTKPLSMMKALDYNTDVYNVSTDPQKIKEESWKPPRARVKPQNTNPTNPFNRRQGKAIVKNKLDEITEATGPDRCAGLKSANVGILDERVVFETVDNPLRWEAKPVYPDIMRTRGNGVCATMRGLALVETRPHPPRFRYRCLEPAKSMPALEMA